MGSNDASTTAVQEERAPRSKGTFTPARNAMFSLTLATFGNYCLLSAGLLLVTASRLRVASLGRFLLVAMGLGALPLVTSVVFYFKDGKRRFSSPVWKWYAGALGVIAIMLAFQVLSVRNVTPGVRGLAALGMLWFTCAVLLPLPQLAERLRARDWKSAGAAIWCMAVMLLLMKGIMATGGTLPQCGGWLAAGAAVWFTGYLARAYWFSRLESMSFRNAFHFLCWPLWIGAVLIYGFSLWVALPAYEKRIAPEREAVAAKFGHSIDRKTWESAYYGSGVRADESLKQYLTARKASAPVNQAEAAILAALPVRQTLEPGEPVLAQSASLLAVLREISQRRFAAGQAALTAKDVPAALKSLAELEALTESVASEPLLRSQGFAIGMAERVLTLGKACLDSGLLNAAQRASVSEMVERLPRSLAKHCKWGWYGEAVSFDEIMTAVRTGTISGVMLRPYGMRYALPQLVVVAAKSHWLGLRHFAGFPRLPKIYPLEVLWRLLEPDFGTYRTAILKLNEQAKALHPQKR